MLNTTWSEQALQLRPVADAVIGGALTPARSGRRRDSVNPATGAVLAQVAECDASDVDAAVASARGAFESGAWSTASPAHRKSVLLRLAESITANSAELALLDSLDGGKLIGDTTQFDVPGSAAILQWYAEAIDKLYGEIAPTSRTELALISREPLGVVGAVVPWNYPLEMAIWKLAPALAAGNSVVLKPAEATPLSALRLGQLALEAGLPDGVLNVVPGDGPVAGKALGLHPDVDALTFTGSTEVGKLFLQYAGTSNMKQVWLECGGKSANVVFADVADLDEVADGVCTGIFTGAGQVCSANSRLLVHESIKDALLQRVVARAEAIRVGDPLDDTSQMGPMVSAQHADRVMGLVEVGRREGRILTGGTRVADAPTSAFVQPTVLDSVAPDARIAQEEVFGPVLAAFAFTDEDQAIALANGSPYALAASVWSDSHSRVHRVAQRLRAGTVSVNCVDALDVTTPFGGFGLSGFGRDLSLHALDKFTGLKTTWHHHN